MGVNWLITLMITTFYVNGIIAGCSGGIATYLYPSDNRSLYSPNYGSNYDLNTVCIYKLEVLTESTFTFTVKHMDIETSTDCTKDYLMLATAYDIDNPWFKLCGGADGVYTAPAVTDVAYVKFRSDLTNVATGFHLEWDYTPVTTTAATTTADPATLCDEVTNLSEDSDKVITSPNYPSSYPKGVECEWRITLSENSRFTFTLESFSLDGGTTNDECANDYLLIANGKNTANPWHKLCGSRSGSYKSKASTKEVYIKFVSDAEVFFRYKGFEMTWEHSPAPEDWVIAVAVAGSIVGAIVIIVLVYCLCCRDNAPCKCSDEGEDWSSAQITWAKSNSQVHPNQQQPVVPMMPITLFKRFDASELTAPTPSTQDEVKPKKAPIRRRKISSDDDDDDDDGDGKPHIMISYQWDVKPQVLEFRALLKEYGYRVWIDVEKMHKNASTFESMASAVENATVVIPVLTDKYQQSVNCRKEIEYADKQKRRLIPIRMENDFEISGWLSFLLGSAQSFDFANPESVDEERANFFKLLKSAAFGAKMEEKDNQDDL